MPGVEVLEEDGTSDWDTPPSPLGRSTRRLVAALAALILLGGGILFVRKEAAEREARQAVSLTVTFQIVTSNSTAPGPPAAAPPVPGGSVHFWVAVRNDGPLPVAVTAVDAADTGLRIRMADDGDRQVPPGREVGIPLSVRLTCAPGTGAAQPSLDAEIGVRREDGGTTSRPAELQPASLVLDVAASLCQVRPDLRDHELSGPVVRSGG